MTDSSDPRLWWIVILRDCSITGSREGKKIWIQIPFCLNCDLDFAGLFVPSFVRTCIFVFVAEFCIFLNLCFPLIFVHFLGFMYFLYCLWWIVIWIVLVAPPLARDGGKNREKKPFWWQSRCLSPSCSYRTLYADRVNVTKWGKKDDDDDIVTGSSIWGEHFCSISSLSGMCPLTLPSLHFKYISKYHQRGISAASNLWRREMFLLFNGKQAANIAWTTPLFL